MKYNFLDVNDEPREILNKSIIEQLSKEKLVVGGTYVIPANNYDDAERKISNPIKFKCLKIENKVAVFIIM